MSDLTQLIQELSTTDDPIQKAAISAEFIIASLPPPIAELARSCAILNWFDEPIIAALLPLVNEESDDSDSTWDVQTVYEQITSLTFVETLAWGQAYHSQTAKGLLAKYSTTQPGRFQAVSALAVPAYLSHSQDKLAPSEALYCYLVAGQHEQARELLDELVFEASRREDWPRVLSYYRVCEQADELLFVDSMKQNEIDYFTRGLATQMIGDIDTAITHYDQAIRIDPEYADAYHNRSVVSRLQGRYDQAEYDYDRSVELNSEYTNIVNTQPNLYTYQKHFSIAIGYSQLIQSHPKDARSYCLRGNAYFRLGQSDTALADYNQAILQDAECVPAYNNSGKIYLEQGYYDKAIENFKKVIQITPEHPNAHANLKNAYKKKSRSSTINWSRNMTRIDFTAVNSQFNAQPYSELAVDYFNEGCIYLRQNEFEKAKHKYNQAIQLSPDYLEAYLHKGICLRQMRYLEEAIAVYDKILEDIDSDCVKVWIALADIAKHKQDKVEWQDSIELARDLLSDSSLYDLASLESVAGNNRVALDWLAKAIDENSSLQEWAQRDPDLEWIREEARFWEIVG